MYDVLIVGCGISGAALAMELSRYQLKVAVLEKENDVALATTKANSAILHAGYDPAPGTLAARLNVEGSRMGEELCRELDVPYKKLGSLVVAFSQEELEVLRTLYDRGCANGVPGLEIIGRERLREMEPGIAPEALGALYAPSAAVVNPWEYAIAMAEAAVKNGVELFLRTEVTGLSKEGLGWRVETNRGVFEAKWVVNAAGVCCGQIHEMAAPPAFSVHPAKGEYYLLDKSEGYTVSHVVFQCPNRDGKGVLVSPTVHGNLIVGPNAAPCGEDDRANTAAGLEFVRTAAKKSVPGINFRENIRNFAGVRANTSCEDFIIEMAGEHFLDVAGIRSPGLTAAPAIGKYAAGLLQKDGLILTKKDSWDGRRKKVRIAPLSPAEKNRLIARNPAYGRVICRCETITEGEILDALHSPIPPVSVDGVKRRAGSGMGRCQGGFCGPRVVEIMAREYGVDPQEILMDRDGSAILTGRTKEGGAKHGTAV
ncbi:MAG: NAD(P)/FAD-dependent oxidoreductase [Oscillospiraceae bacterium]|nr:NAD(P)/FAD-dependent oxidoreductase [Oscillospiraceae bacterium]